MSILLVTAVFPPEPVVSAKLSYDIASELCKTNDIIVLSPPPSRPFGFRFENQDAKFKFNHIKTQSYVYPKSNFLGRFRESYSFGKHCYWYITKNKKEIRLIYGNTFPLLSQYFLVKAAKKFNIPIVIHVQDIYPESITNKLPNIFYLFTSILLKLDTYVLHNSSRIIVISDRMKEYLIKTRKIEKSRLTIIANWQDETAFIEYRLKNERLTDDSGQFTFMYLGNIGPVAGIEFIISAFVRAKIKNSRLIIAGDGSMKESLIKRVNEYKKSNIEFWSVPEGQVPEIQSQADILILPMKKNTATSSIPSKLTAYMFSQKPIIACVDKDSDIANALNEAGNGWVVEPENTESLSKTMVAVADIPIEELMILGKKGYNYALTNFSKRINLDKLIKIIYEVYNF